MARNATVTAIDPTVVRFAKQLVESISASKVLLAGSLKDDADDVSNDIDLIVVSPQFNGVDRFEREYGLKGHFYALGGTSPMQLHCLTPEEFELGSTRISTLAAVLPEAIDLAAANRIPPFARIGTTPYH